MGDVRPAVTVRLSLSPNILSVDSYVATRQALRVVRDDALKTAAAAEQALRALNQAAASKGIRARGPRPHERLAEPPDDAV